MGHVAKAEGQGDAVKLIVGKWQGLAVTDHGVKVLAMIKHAIAATAEHLGIDVAHDDPTSLSDLGRHGQCQITRTTGNVEDLVALSQVGLGNGEGLPESVKPGRHDVIHDVIVVGDRVKNPANVPRLFLLRDLLKAKMCLCHAVSVPAWQVAQRADAPPL